MRGGGRSSLLDEGSSSAGDDLMFQQCVFKIYRLRHCFDHAYICFHGQEANYNFRWTLLTIDTCIVNTKNCER